MIRKNSGKTIGADVFLVRNANIAPSPAEQKFIDLMKELLALYLKIV